MRGFIFVNATISNVQIPTTFCEPYIMSNIYFKIKLIWKWQSSRSWVAKEGAKMVMGFSVSAWWSSASAGKEHSSWLPADADFSVFCLLGRMGNRLYWVLTILHGDPHVCTTSSQMQCPLDVSVISGPEVHPVISGWKKKKFSKMQPPDF